MSTEATLRPTTGIESTLAWFKIARPEPSPADFLVQLGVHFEEVGEMIQELTPINETGTNILTAALFGISQLATHLKESGGEASVFLHEGDRQAFLDAGLDQIVTVIGTLDAAQMDPINGLEEVNRSNFSKFVDGKPVFKSNGKIGKGPNYSEPDLSPFI